nr:hypothetical protein [Pseudotabrizicola alkalilacus]
MNSAAKTSQSKRTTTATRVMLMNTTGFSASLIGLNGMGVLVMLVSSRAVPASIAPPPPLIDLAEEFIDINEDERFFLAYG